MNWYLQVLQKYEVFNIRVQGKEYCLSTLFYMILP